MKKYLSLIIILLMMVVTTSCFERTNEFKDSVSEKYVVKMAKTDLEKRLYNNEEYDAFLTKVQDFSYKLSEYVYEDYEEDNNFVISPYSVFMALAMTVESTNGTSREEILNALNMSYEELYMYVKNLYSDHKKEFKGENMLGNKFVQGLEDINNSIWVEEGLTLKEDTMNSLADNFYVSTYKVPFVNNIDKANQAFRSYIKNATRGLIDKDFNISNETIFMLVNTYYLKDIWDENIKELSFTKETYNFINFDESTTNTKLLMGDYFDGKPYETEMFKTATTRTNHGYRIKFILPQDGYTVEDIYTREVLKEVSENDAYLAVDDVNMEMNHTKCYFPEYDAEYDGDIRNALSEKFGIKSVFNIDTADFTSLVDGPAFIQQVLHQTKLTVNRYGIEGAAVTVQNVCGSAGPGPYTNVYHTFVVDKAFAFIITDYLGTVVFSGVTKSI